MSSREDILASIRQHTQTRYDKPDIADMKRLSYPDKIEQFCAISRAVGGAAVVLGEGEDVNAVIRRTYPDAMRIASVLPDISCATFNPDNLDDPKELDGTDVAVVKGEIGVAENGAIWIPQTVKYKAIYFISEKLVILLDRNKIVDTMYDAYRELDGQEYQFGTFISGPSNELKKNSNLYFKFEFFFIFNVHLFLSIFYSPSLLQSSPQQPHPPAATPHP